MTPEITDSPTTVRRRYAAIVFVIVACGCQQVPMRGVVAKKQHRPAWLQVVISGNAVIPIMHPEQWELVVQADGTDGEEGRFLVVVHKATWNDLDVGDVWQRADTVYEDR